MALCQYPQITLDVIKNIGEKYKIDERGFTHDLDDDVRYAIKESTLPEVIRCVDFIDVSIEPRKTFNFKMSSYWFKHRVEEIPGTVYICNGAFIIAAILCGYRTRPTSNGVNSYHNMKFKGGCGLQWR